jgi:hypothetical protein
MLETSPTSSAHSVEPIPENTSSSDEGFINTTQQTENQQPTNNEVSINSALVYKYYMGPTQIPTFESTKHYHQNQLQTLNQYVLRFYNSYNCNETCSNQWELHT